MSDLYIYLNIFIMAAVTYLIRVIPLLLLRKPIKNRFFRSFLFYSPYITLAVMTFPAVLNATQNSLTSIIGFITAVVLSFIGVNFVITTFGTCLIVLIIQLFIH